MKEKVKSLYQITNRMLYNDIYKKDIIVYWKKEYIESLESDQTPNKSHTIEVGGVRPVRSIYFNGLLLHFYNGCQNWPIEDFTSDFDVICLPKEK